MNLSREESFFEACGLVGPLRLVVRGPGEDSPRSFPSDQPFLVLGREPGAGLILDDPQVSGRHAYLQAIAGRIFAIDLGSREGLDWGSGRAPFGWISSDQSVAVGSFRVRLAEELMAVSSAVGWPTNLSNPLSSRPNSHERLSPVVLDFPDRGATKSAWVMRNAIVLIGRSRTCRVRIDDPDAERFHASIVRTPTGSWVVDLTGREGIEINGQTVPFGLLADGDIVRLGKYRIVVRIPIGDVPPRSTALRRRDRTRQDVATVGSIDNRPGVPRAVTPDQIIPVGTALVGGSLDPSLAIVIDQMARQQQQMFDQFHQAMALMAQMVGELHRDQTARMTEEIERLRELNLQLSTLQAGRLPESAPAPTPAIDAPPRSNGPSPGPLNRPHRPRESVSRSSTNAAASPLDSAPPTIDGPELHEEITRRIAAIQAEQKTRWQRIFDQFASRND